MTNNLKRIMQTGIEAIERQDKLEALRKMWAYEERKWDEEINLDHDNHIREEFSIYDEIM